MNISRIIKNAIPASFKAFIRLGSSRKKYKNRIASLKTRKEPYVILIGTPVHTNLGDHLIALAEIDWLKKTTGKDVVEIPREVYHLYRGKLADTDADIYITGGGWMGDLWPNEERDIQNMVNLFQNRKVTIFPQTVYYENKNNPLIERGNNIYKNCKDLTLHVRERDSYETAKDYLSIENVILSPDMGLLYKYKPQPIKNNSVAGVCLRDDREVSRNNDMTEKVIELIRNLGFSEKTVSTMSDHRVSEDERKEAVDAAIDVFSECGLLIVDRLHAMVFSYLAGRPCIAFDNKTGKVSGVYKQWLADCPYILMIDENTEISEIKRFIENVKGASFAPKTFEFRG